MSFEVYFLRCCFYVCNLFFRDQVVHWNVMSLNRDLVDNLYLKSKGYSQSLRCLLGEKAVIIAAAISEPASLPVKDTSRQQHHINFGGIPWREAILVWFRDITVTGPQVFFRVCYWKGNKAGRFGIVRGAVTCMFLLVHSSINGRVSTSLRKLI